MFTIGTRKLRILDFDTECRPMHYNEWKPESQITAIAWSWIGNRYVDADVLLQNLANERTMLERFLEQYNAADIVTGHYVRRHDLPLLNDHSLRLLGKPISSKLVVDTMVDMTSVKSLGKSQDNLAITLGVSETKHHMTGADWRLANSLVPAGQALAVRRVVMDVRQHKAIHRALLDMGALGAPEVWRP